MKKKNGIILLHYYMCSNKVNKKYVTIQMLLFEEFWHFSLMNEMLILTDYRHEQS